MRFTRLVSTLGVSALALAAGDAPVIDPNSELGQGVQLGQTNLFERQQIANENIFNRRQGGCGARPRACINNLCARVVKEDGDEAPALTSRQEDCSSFMHKTVSYDLTTTVTVETAIVKRRQQTIRPSDVPSYATAACTDAEKYSSACSCWGITASTTTVSSVATLTVEPPAISTSSTLFSSVISESSVVSSVTSVVSESSAISVSSVPSESSAASSVSLVFSVSSIAPESSAVSSVSSAAVVSSVVPSVASVSVEPSAGSSIALVSVEPSSVSSVASVSVEPSAVPVTTRTGIIQARRVDNGDVLGYFKVGGAAQPTFDTNANNAMQFRAVGEVSGNALSSVNLELVNTDRGAYFGMVVGRDSANGDMAAGSFHYLYPSPVSQSTDPGSVPQSVPNYYSTISGYYKQAETSLWNINFSTGAVTASWVNTDGSTPNILFWTQSNYLYAGGDPARFYQRFPSPGNIVSLHWVSTGQDAAPTSS